MTGRTTQQIAFQLDDMAPLIEQLERERRRARAIAWLVGLILFTAWSIVVT
jgi:hypothetical protein